MILSTRSMIMMLLLALGAMPSWAGIPNTSDVFYEQRLGQQLPLHIRFRDEHGRAISLDQVTRDRPTVLAFGYFACPALCGLIRDDMLTGLAQTAFTAGRDYQIVFVSIDPSETSADAAKAMDADLRAYPMFGVGKGWHFLTGEAASVSEIEAAAGYHSRYDLSLKQFIHPSGLIIVSPSGIISSYLLGIGFSPGDLRTAIIRAESGGVAKAVQPVLLLCFHYDATTGRYTLEVVKLLQIGAVLTIVSISVLLFVLWWRMRLARRLAG